MRRLLMAVALLLMVPGVAAAGGFEASPCPPFAKGTTVSMLDACFDGTTHFAPAGMAITVRNDGMAPHTYTAIDGSFDSGQLQTGETFELTIDTPGIFEVFCTLHGTADGQGMAGVLIVGEPEPAAFAATVDLSPLTLAIQEGDQTVSAALDRHSRAIRDLTTAQRSLEAALVEAQATSGVDAGEQTEEETAGVVPGSLRSDSDRTWVPLASGLALGIAIALLLSRREPGRGRRVGLAAGLEPPVESH